MSIILFVVSVGTRIATSFCKEGWCAVFPDICFESVTILAVFPVVLKCSLSDVNISTHTFLAHVKVMISVIIHVNSFRLVEVGQATHAPLGTFNFVTVGCTFMIVVFLMEHVFVAWNFHFPIMDCDTLKHLFGNVI